MGDVSIFEGIINSRSELTGVENNRKRGKMKLLIHAVRAILFIPGLIILLITRITTELLSVLDVFYDDD